MKPHLLKIDPPPGTSFEVRRDLFPINRRWHCHEEIELIYIAKGTGMLLIGDHVRLFTAGTICLIGPHVPHYWRFDDRYHEAGTDESINVIAIHFLESFWGQKFLKLPENTDIRLLLENAKRGILIDEMNEALTGSFENVLNTDRPYRIISLLTLLTSIAGWKNQLYLSSTDIQLNVGATEEERINEVYEYSIKNFRKKIQLDEIAKIAGVRPNSFCRFFKLRTRKTYSQFIAELRIAHVCKLLEKTDNPIKKICYDSGFYNFTSFHKCFKQVTGMSPLSYQKKFKPLPG